MALVEGAARSRPQHYRPTVDLIVRHQNPDASAELTIPVNLVCNTPDEVLIANVKENSKRQNWLEPLEETNRPAILVGGGPSIKSRSMLMKIALFQANGGVVFAMNGAAGYLVRNGIKVDYQVIVDARERTADLICHRAKSHLFSATVHPSLFDKAPHAALFHVSFFDQVGDYLDQLPPDRVSDPETFKPFVCVGSHGSVGNVALSLVYAMGHREYHVFGYDSSFEGNAGHAYSQPMNATEPVCDVEYAGRKYQCTFTMKSQADVFPRVAYELEQMGVTFHVYGSGYLQDRWNGEKAKTPEQREADKYMEMWEHPDYRRYAPGVDHVTAAVEKLGMMPDDMVADFGCGTGRAAALMRNRGMMVVGIDIARNALEESIHFIRSILWDEALPVLLSSTFKPKWGFCTDVMEHIPPDKVENVLFNIAASCTHGAYFAIDDHVDEMGALIGKPLHLTRRPPQWWEEALSRYFASVEREGETYVCKHGQGE